MLSTNAAEPNIPVVERRRNRRNRSLLGAQIVFREGYCSMACLVLDISEDGALLRPDDVVSCPKSFVLKPRLGTPRKCEIVWRKGDKIGVRFL